MLENIESYLKHECEMSLINECEEYCYWFEKTTYRQWLENKRLIKFGGIMNWLKNQEYPVIFWIHSHNIYRLNWWVAYIRPLP